MGIQRKQFRELKRAKNHNAKRGTIESIGSHAFQFFAEREFGKGKLKLRREELRTKEIGRREKGKSRNWKAED
jgi:hypothetical protein